MAPVHGTTTHRQDGLWGRCLQHAQHSSASQLLHLLRATQCVWQAGACYWLHVAALVITTLLPLTLTRSLTGLTCQGAVECLQPCCAYD